jgi:hypothetical protein
MYYHNERLFKYTKFNSNPEKDMARILMEHGEIKKLAEKFSVSLPTVRDALRFKTKSTKANMLRKAALENGGVLKEAKVLKKE